MSGEHRLELYVDRIGQWRWRRRAGNNEIVSDSGEGYINRADAVNMAKDVNPGLEISDE